MEENAPERSGTIAAFRVLVNRYHGDPAYRRRVEADPVSAFGEKGIDLPAGIELPAGVEFRVVANTDDRLYVPFPPDPNLSLSDEALAAVAGAGLGQLSSASSASTFSSISSCLGTISSASTSSEF